MVCVWMWLIMSGCTRIWMCVFNVCKSAWVWRGNIHLQYIRDSNKICLYLEIHVSTFKLIITLCIFLLIFLLLCTKTPRHFACMWKILPGNKNDSHSDVSLCCIFKVLSLATPSGHINKDTVADSTGQGHSTKFWTLHLSIGFVY